MDSARAEVVEAVTLKPREALERRAIFGLVNLSHLVNHLQGGLVQAFYPIFREEFAIGFTGLALISTLTQAVSGTLQGSYGLMARHTGRGVLLATGQIITAVGGIGLGFSHGFAQLMAWMTMRAVGNIPQHPMGAATLVSYYSRQRAQLLGFHQSAGNVGGLIAPLLAGALLYFMGWRQILWIMAPVSLVMGLAYFGFRDLMRPAPPPEGIGRHGRSNVGLSDYASALKDRNVIFLTLAMLLGASGRGTAVLSIFLAAYLVDKYAISVSEANFFASVMMIGAIVGPIGMGWLADRFSRKLLAQFSLLGAAVLTYTFIFYPELTPFAALHLFFAGIFTWSRGPLVESLFSQATAKASLDTLLSIYYAFAFAGGTVWGLVAGRILDVYGEGPAFALMGGLYLIAIVVLAFVRFEPGQQQGAAARSGEAGR